jgi:hypothetical protein
VSDPVVPVEPGIASVETVQPASLSSSLPDGPPPPAAVAVPAGDLPRWPIAAADSDRNHPTDGHGGP